MRTFIVAAAVVAATLLPTVPLAQDAEVTTTHVAGSVYMLKGMGGNIGVTVGDDGVILVDDQMKPVLEKIKAAIAKLNKGGLRFVINTHYHGDHVGNNAVFSDEATIVAHTNVRERLMNPGEDDLVIDESGWPILTFDQSVTIHFNGEDIRVIHVPRGHTDGDCIVYFAGSNVLHAGDQMFTGLFPFIDIDGGGSLEGYTKNLDYILANFPADAKVIAGHGPLATMDDVRASRDMIVATGGIVRAKMKAGKSLEEIQGEGLPGFKSFDWDFITMDLWIETIWKSASN